MQINLLLSVLVHKGVLLEEEAAALAREISQSILPTDFETAHRIVESVLRTVKDKADKAEKYALESAARIKAEKSAKK